MDINFGTKLAFYSYARRSFPLISWNLQPTNPKMEEHMKKIIILAAILGLGFVSMVHADDAATAMTPTAAAAPMAKKAHKTHKHKHHAKKAMAAAVSGTASATSGTAQ
jgi:hypothetical protein